MKSLQCLIIDDEPIARKIIKEYISDVDFLELQDEAEDPVVANNLLRSKKIDLIFLDIEMPKMTGINFLKNITNPPFIILTTAYPEYALEGYELNVLDYLVKPIGFERFLKAANKAFEIVKLTQTVVTSAATSDFFFVKCNNKIEKIQYKNVLCFEGMDNYLVIYTESRKYIVYLTFKNLENLLCGVEFIRIHKSYIISINAIDSIDDHSVHIGKNSLPIGKYYRKKNVATDK